MNRDKIEEVNILASSVRESKKIILPNGKSVSDCGAISRRNFPLFLIRKGKIPTILGLANNVFLSPISNKARKHEGFQPSNKNKIFIVHGRDETPALSLQKHLTKDLKLEAEMFEDVKKKFSSRTVIELLEYIVANTAYAFVIATPDDFGCFGQDIEKGERDLLLGKDTVKAEDVTKLMAKLSRRARQNVVFEHGLFIGALGRDRVCCLLKEGVTEQESDIHGVLYESFKESVSEKFSDIESKLSDQKIGLIKK